MNKIFKINFKSHFRHLWILIFLAILIPLGIYFLMIYRYNSYDRGMAFIFEIIAAIVFIVPSIVLHFNYYFSNRDTVLKYSHPEKRFELHRGISNETFFIEDIKEIVCYKSITLSEGRTPMFPWDMYNYASITLKSDKLIIISSLLVNELDKNFEIKDVTIKKTFYPLIW